MRGPCEPFASVFMLSPFATEAPAAVRSSLDADAEAEAVSANWCFLECSRCAHAWDTVVARSEKGAAGTDSAMDGNARQCKQAAKVSGGIGRGGAGEE